MFGSHSGRDPRSSPVPAHTARARAHETTVGRNAWVSGGDHDSQHFKNILLVDGVVVCLHVAAAAVKRFKQKIDVVPQTRSVRASAF